MLEHLISTENDIRIKKENQGKFTKYCESKGYTKVTNGCIKEGLKDSDPQVRKEANFARNAKGWNHG